MSRHSLIERIILSLGAWHRAAHLLQTRCRRLRANRDTWRRLCDDRAICGICHDVLQQEHCDDFDRPWVPREDWAQARTWAARWKAVAHRWRRAEKKMKCNCALVLLSENVAVLQADRFQGRANDLADQLHAWHQACQDHGIEATPEALRAVLRRVDAGCVAEAPRCLDCDRSAEQVDGRWRPRCWCVGFADELAEADL